MAKKKSAPIEEIKAEAVVVESVEKKKEQVSDDTEKFIYAQLQTINRMGNRAKAKRLAERVLSNRRKG